MTYKTEDLEAEALKVIKDNGFVFIEDVVSAMECGKKTFYNHELHELHTIKEALTTEKVKVKQGLRIKWYEGDNATTQIALYKLVSTDDEHDKLTGTKTKLEHSGGLDLKSMDDDELDSKIRTLQRTIREENKASKE